MGVVGKSNTEASPRTSYWVFACACLCDFQVSESDVTSGINEQKQIAVESVRVERAGQWVRRVRQQSKAASDMSGIL